MAAGGLWAISVAGLTLCKLQRPLLPKWKFFFLSSRNARRGFEDRIRIFEEQSKQQTNNNNNINKTSKQQKKFRGVLGKDMLN